MITEAERKSIKEMDAQILLSCLLHENSVWSNGGDWTDSARAMAKEIDDRIQMGEKAIKLAHRCGFLEIITHDLREAFKEITTVYCHLGQTLESAHYMHSSILGIARQALYNTRDCEALHPKPKTEGAE